MNTYIPEGYKSLLGVYDTQKAIGLLKRLFEDQLAAKLNLFRVSAPLFLEEASGLNDNLNGYERPVLFDIPQAGKEAQVVQSLAKWKRMALHRYDFYPGKGLYTDMNAIRRDEDVLDNLHSVYVDQWDWEKIIESSDRNLDYLKSTVMDIVAAVCDTQRTMRAIYPQLQVLPELERQVTFVTAQELEDRYPDLTPKEREHTFVREHHTTFIIGIGGALRSGKPHDGRSPDYDDWTMNGDILFWNELLDCAFELSSMGIRVDPESLDRQLTIAGCDDRRERTYHKMLLAGQLPPTIGGGIGQSRLSMLLLGKAHIGEVQASVWDDETTAACEQVHRPLGSPYQPQGQGFMAQTSMNSHGKVCEPCTREMVTCPSSSGWRMDSMASRRNSGSSSRNSTPLCAREISPGRTFAPPPASAAAETVWCGLRNGRDSMSG